MTNAFFVRFAVPIRCAWFVQTPGLIFHRWLPLNQDDAYVYHEDNFTLRLWVDETCLGNITPIADFSRYHNLIVEKIFADILVVDYTREFIDYVLGDSPETEELRSQYDLLGEKLLSLVIDKVNRLIDYCQIELGQYWLLSYDKRDVLTNAYQYNLKFKALVLTDFGETRWHPPSQNSTRLPSIAAAFDKARYVSEERWPEIKSFLASDIRTSRIWYMLTEAEYLAASGHRRSAIVLAISALEQALYSFASSPKAWNVVAQPPRERMELHSLKNWLKNHGISGALDYLLPILFSEQTISTDCLGVCRRAYDKRNNIIHNGSRSAGEEETQEFLDNIRDLVKVLTDLSSNTEDTEPESSS